MIDRKRLLAAALLAVLPHAATAVPIDYDESVNGDLADFFLSGVDFELGVGVNRFTGAYRSSSISRNRDDDYINFSLAQGTRLIAGDITLRGVDNNGTLDSGSTFLRLASFPPFNKITDSESINLLTEVGATEALPSTDLPVLPLDSATAYYSAIPAGRAAGLNGPLDVTIQYTVTLTTERVAQIPLPAAALLMIAALGGLGIAARRRPTQTP